METLRFSKEAILALPIPARRTRYADAKQPGLIVAINPGGSRVYYVFKRSRGKLYEERVGDVTAISVEAAREKARAILADLDQGRDPGPNAARKRAGETFGDLWIWWADNYGRPRRARWSATQATYDNHIAKRLGLRPMSLLSRADVRDLHRAIGKEAGERTANVVLGLVRVVINKAITEGRWLGINPAAGLEGFKRPARARVLSREEAKRLREAIAATRMATRRPAQFDVADLAELLLLTGQRLGNVLTMRWDEVDLDHGAWVIPRTKAGRVHGVALSSAEVALLRERLARDGRGEYVFPARADSKTKHMTRPAAGWRALLKRAGIENFTLHDLRRSHGSWLLAAGVSLDAISKIMDHSSVAVTEKVYAHLDLTAKRAAKQRALDAED